MAQTTKDKILLEFDDIPPSLNGRGGMLRNSHWERKNMQAVWDLSVRRILNHLPYSLVNPPIEKCAVVWTVRSQQYWDWDNLNAAFKMLGDALVHNKLLVDDSVRHIVRWRAVYKRVKKDERGCAVDITVLKRSKG